MKLATALGSAVVALALSQPATSRPVPGLTGPQASEPVTLYRTLRGDTLDGLAVRYLTGRGDVAVVARLSGITNPDRVPVGALLRIPDRLLKSTPMTLTAIAVTGAVVRAGAAGPAEPLSKGDLVSEGDRIATGANAFATLAKPDGSRITLPSHTVLRVAVLRRVVLGDAAAASLVVDSGRAELAVKPLQPADRFEIRTPGSVAAVRGTEFRVAYDTDRSVSTLEVLHGGVGESATETGPSADIVTGQASQRPLGGERAITPLPPAPTFAPPDAEADFPAVTFRIADPRPGWSYHVLLARDPAFTDPLAEVTTADGAARFDGLPLAPFSAKVTAIDENGVEGFPMTYLVERPPPPGSASGG
jgi:hypothetical protein